MKKNATLGLHARTTGKHGSQIASRSIKRNPKSLEILFKGYDDQKIRRLAHQHEIRLPIKHRAFTPLHKAWNLRLDTDLCDQ